MSQVDPTSAEQIQTGLPDQDMSIEDVERMQAYEASQAAEPTTEAAAGITPIPIPIPLRR